MLPGSTTSGSTATRPQRKRRTSRKPPSCSTPHLFRERESNCRFITTRRVLNRSRALTSVKVRRLDRQSKHSPVPHGGRWERIRVGAEKGAKRGKNLCAQRKTRRRRPHERRGMFAEPSLSASLTGQHPLLSARKPSTRRPPPLLSAWFGAWVLQMNKRAC